MTKHFFHEVPGDRNPCTGVVPFILTHSSGSGKNIEMIE